jgi:methylamine dehydrogenase light chain
MHPLDRIFENSARSLAKRTSRRSLLASLGQILTGAALIPLLPIDRTARAQTPGKSTAPPAEPRTTLPPSTARTATAAPVDPTAAAKSAPGEKDCEYWKYCAIDGFLCSCCGGTSNSCPPGTQPSPITWIGTCHNPGDGRDYIISYNDCCGKVSCGDCFCNRNEAEKPMYRLSRNNDVNWCMANTESDYHCSVSVILGVAQE